MLRRLYPDLTYKHPWVQLPSYGYPAGWTGTTGGVAFKIKSGHPERCPTASSSRGEPVQGEHAEQLHRAGIRATAVRGSWACSRGSRTSRPGFQRLTRPTAATS